MLLGVIPMFCFGIFEKNRKSAKTRKFGHYQAPTPQPMEPAPQPRPTQRRGIPSLGRGQGAKMAPLGYATA